MPKNQSQDILQLFSLYTFCYLIFLCLQNVMISPIFLLILDNLLQCYKHQFLYILNNMLQQQLQILENISNVSKHQNVLLKTPQNAQQQFFHLWAHRSLIKQKFMHPKVEQTLLYLPGTFSNQALHHQYMLYCIQNKIELTSDNFPLIEKLITWTEQYPTFKAKSPISLTNIVFDNNSYDVFNNINTLITFIDVISPDIIKLIRKKGKINESQPQKVQQYHVNMLTADDLILFLTIVLPKVLFNLLLQNRLLPGQEKNQNKSIQCLYKLSSVQFYLKTKNNYYSLIRTLIKILLSFQLKPPQQKKLMESIFNYFYAYHHDKKSHSTDYFIEAYNQLDQTTRFALSDQFLLFFRIIKKVGKGKFLNFLLQKSPWLKQISNKISDNLLIGYPKDNLVPFNVCHMIGQGMVVNNGSKQYRYFEILQQYSTFYYKIGIKSQDITVRLYYLGQFDKKTSRKFLLQHQKLSGQKTNNVLAVKKGLYMFQFDNSYSWINKKVIRYQNVILNPLQLKSTDPAKWINSFYQNIQGNQAIKDIITILLKPIKKKQQKKYQGTCNISKNGPFFNLKLTKANKIYEFQSQTQQKLIKKFNELLQSQKNINWLVDSQPLDTDEAVLNKIKGYPNQKGKNINEENPINNKKEQKISQNVNQADKIDIQGASFNQTAEQQ